MISANTLPRLAALLALSLGLVGCGPQDEGTVVPQEQPPAWLAPFQDVAVQWRFRVTLEGLFAERGIDVRLDQDGRYVEVRGKGRVFDVTEVARACADLPERDWRAALDTQLGLLLDTSDALATWEPPAWEEARPRLRARIYADGFLSAAGMAPGDVVDRVDLEGTLTCAVLDRDDSALLLPGDAPTTWQLDDDQVLSIAIENTRAELEGHLTLNQRDLGEFGTLYEVAGDSYYATLAVLWLDHWPELLGKHGAFVAVPWRQSVLVLPFDDARARHGVPGLYAVAREVVAEGHGAVTPSVWWRRPDGGFDRIRIEEHDGTPSAIPSRRLAELLQELLPR